MFRSLALGIGFATGLLSATVSAAPLSLDFRPPDIEPRDVCFRPGTPVAPNRLDEQGDEALLTDAQRISYLRRDIQSFSAEDADKYYAFINALIRKRGEIDESFTPVDQVFAQLDLIVQAGRIDDGELSDLLDTLRRNADNLANNQLILLARFYAQGIGVPADPAFAQSLILEAAYGGNANALLEIVRLAQQGTLVEGWDAPLDLTTTMAFGGLLGVLDAGVCARAERLSNAYRTGDVVEPNAELALAWLRFAADMGGARAAWKMVEHHLVAEESDHAELRHYLEQALRLGVSLSLAQRAQLASSGAMEQSDLETLLGFNAPQGERRGRHSLADDFSLVVNIDGIEPDEDGPFFRYLKEIAQLPEAPGRIFDRLAAETMIRKGRWAGEQDAMALLEEAVRRGDGPGQRRLARMLVRYRDDPAQIARAESLLMEVVSRHAMPEAMRDLDRLYRCQVTDAPRLSKAKYWADSYRATGHGTLSISAGDLLALTGARKPEAIAAIQTHALRGRSQMLASFGQMMQAAPFSSAEARRFWAGRVDNSDQALEAFAELELELAHSPAQRDLAIEVFRRVYLNNGVTTALDLAIALTEYDARAPGIAKEIETLLTMAGNRGEGAAIRLMARLQSRTRTEADVFAQFEQAIEDRGDFLAMMFAMPHIAADKVEDYIDRAVSLMNCGTKDADELGEAAALLDDAEMSFQWRRIAVHFEGGNVLSRLRLSETQMGAFDTGAATGPVLAGESAWEEGNPAALTRLIELTSDPTRTSYDAEAAAGYLSELMANATPKQMGRAAVLYRQAPKEVQRAVEQAVDLPSALSVAAEAGDLVAIYEFALYLRDIAQSSQELGFAVGWMARAAEKGHREAMFELGQALGFGLGVAEQPVEALDWLARAEAMGHSRAAAIAHLVRLRSDL